MLDFNLHNGVCDLKEVAVVGMESNAAGVLIGVPKWVLGSYEVEGGALGQVGSVANKRLWEANQARKSQKQVAIGQTFP